jgi:hypothetical protein
LRGVRALTGIVQADLTAWRAPGPVFALVLCTGYWDPDVFAAAASAVAPGGLLAWEAFTLDAAPRIPPEWCLRDGEPGSLLPAGFAVLRQRDVRRQRRQLLARNLAT